MSANEQDSYQVTVTREVTVDGQDVTQSATVFINPNTGTDSQIGDFVIDDEQIAAFKTLVDVKDMDGEEVDLP